MGAPSGTVTFLFTDIEGSTRLWQLNEAAMREAVRRHDEMLRATVAECAGVVFSTMGDGLASAFTSAHAALRAAGLAQDRLSKEEWTTAEPVRVRMGLHSGEAEERDGDYFGTAVNRAARLMAIGHGGQVLCSSTTAELLEGSVTLVDLGEHRLRDLDRPMHVFQVDNGRFPPLRSLSVLPGNLPVQVTGFVGRDQDLGECAEALGTSRVVTVTGVGGVGKTRLALQVAAEVLPRFVDGAWLVEFGGVGDPATVAEAAAAALGVQPRANQPLANTLLDFLWNKHLLLVLDNCEHLVGAVATLVERVVTGCPDVVVLATSRESLAVSGEHLVPLPPMQLPAGDTLDVVASCEAVRLFVDRAGDVRPGFTVTSDNVSVLAQLCRRLDGIPLALELAAARVRSMSLADILSHLDRRFRLLTGGRRSALSRQQTLRGAIDWSYDLLDNPERALLGRLAVFAGGFDLTAAEAVGEDGPVDALDVAVLLDHLVDKSLVVADPSGPSSRFRLLEMIRDYTWDRLGESGETENVSRRHAQYYQAFAAAADRGLRGPDEVSWTEQVERDLDNLRAAVSWAVEAGEVDVALGIITSLASGFGTRIGAPFGPVAERAAAMSVALGHPLRGVALASAARSARDRGEGDRARLLAEEALMAAAALPPGRASAHARCRTISGVLVVLSVVEAQDIAWHRDLSEQRLAAAIELDDVWEKALALVQMVGPFLLSDRSRAVASAEEALRLARRLANPSVSIYAPMTVGTVVADTDPGRAEMLFDEAIRTAGALQNHFAEIRARQFLGRARTLYGDHVEAAHAYLESAELANRVGDRLALFHSVGGIACNLAELGGQEPALLLAAWVEDRGHWPPDWSSDRPFGPSPTLARLRTESNPDTRQQLQERTESMTDAEAIALAGATLEALSQD
jgi:predicted ATPase/class 3 adenylate cyclase